MRLPLGVAFCPGHLYFSFLAFYNHFSHFCFSSIRLRLLRLFLPCSSHTCLCLANTSVPLLMDAAVIFLPSFLPSTLSATLLLLFFALLFTLYFYFDFLTICLPSPGSSVSKPFLFVPSLYFLLLCLLLVSLLAIFFAIFFDTLSSSSYSTAATSSSSSSAVPTVPTSALSSWLC